MSGEVEGTAESAREGPLGAAAEGGAGHRAGGGGPDTDLLVIGGGPAGCAAVLMAESLGMRTVLVESGDALCGTLQRVAALDNMPGFSTGPRLAAAITADIARCGGCRVELGRRADLISVYGDQGDQVEATLTATGDLPGTRLTASYAVVATGVSPLGPEDVGWVLGAGDHTSTPLWRADPATLTGRTVLVLGADRPLGTYLRAHPDLDARFVVAHPSDDAYKAEEVRRDPRVELLPVVRLAFPTPKLEAERGPGAGSGPTAGRGPGSAGVIVADGLGTDGQRLALTADVVFLNAGNGPAPPAGSITTDASGYCPPSRQHPRIFTAGDLRSARFQRIAAAIGSGSEAALGAYYAERGLPT